MNSRGAIRKIQARISQAQTNRALHRFLAGTASKLCNPLCTPSPMNCSVEWRGMENDAGSREVWLTHSRPGVGSGEQQNHECCLVARASLLACALQTGRFHRAPSLPDSPMSHSVTRSVLFPRHISPSRKDRVPGPQFCGLRASAFPGLLPQPEALGPHSEKCSSCLGSGAHSRRFAQECPE
jgi:hypothetical protein